MLYALFIEPNIPEKPDKPFTKNEQNRQARREKPVLLTLKDKDPTTGAFAAQFAMADICVIECGGILNHHRYKPVPACRTITTTL